MAVHNADIARAFDEIAGLLEIQGENPFRIRACRNAARTANEFPRDLKVLLDGAADLAAGRIFPPAARLRDVAAAVARAVAEVAYAHDLATRPRPADLAACIESQRYVPRYARASFGGAVAGAPA